MRPKDNELAAVVYADVFGYPLTVKEAKLWAIRKTREANSLEKEKIALKEITWLKKIPTVAAVFLTGSVAINNAARGADVDLMIVTVPNTLWLTRLVIFPWLKRKVCPNIFLDLNHLEIQNKNLFTAHEVLQAKCLYDQGGIYKKWLEANRWTKEYLPQAFQKTQKTLKTRISENLTVRKSDHLTLRVFRVFWIFEAVAFLLQYLYMKGKMTNERVGWGYAFFHPNNLSQEVLKKFRQRLLKYTNQ